METKNVIKNLILPTIISALLTALVLLLIKTVNVVQTITIGIATLYWTITMISIPVRKEENPVKNIFRKNPLLTALTTTILPYVLLIMGKTANTGTILIFSAYYLLPAIIIVIPETSEKIKQNQIISTVFVLLGATIAWIGFDNRYTKPLFDGIQGTSYLFNSLWLASMLITTIGVFQGVIDEENPEDNGIAPTLYGTKTAIIVWLTMAPIIIVLGFAIDFLHWNPAKSNAVEALIGFLGIFLTIAYQEELVFRGILLLQLSRLVYVRNSKNLQYVVFVLVAFLFALIHWNNTSGDRVWKYIFLAFIAGLGYGYAFKKAGLFSSMLVHTMIDFVWAMLFK